MTARIIDGKTIAADLRGKVTDCVHRLLRDRGLVPGIAVVLVGENPASEVYVRTKSKMVAAAGMHALDRKLPATTSEAELLALVGELNADPAVNGILVQLPLPPQIDSHKIIAAIDPAKDVDGFHPLNVGRLASGLPALVPCTPLGCVWLAKTVHDSLAGLEAVGTLEALGKACVERDVKEGGYPMYQDPEVLGPLWLNYHRLLRRVKKTFDPQGLSNPPRPLKLLSVE